MIHSFSVSNYRSIREETTLDLRIPATAPDLPRFRKCEARPDVRLPTAVVVMGPNGSGKTTLLRALVSVAQVMGFALHTAEPTSKAIPFLSRECVNEPTVFCLELSASWLNDSPSLFRYELWVRDSQIVHEALFHSPKNRLRRLFERGEPGEAIYVSHEFDITPNDARLEAVREDASVIATLALLNVPLARRIADEVTFFVGSSNLIEQAEWALSTDVAVKMMETDANMKSWVDREIQRSDLAIREMIIREGVKGKQVEFGHDGLDEMIPLSFESAGTNHFFHLLPRIYLALSKGTPSVIDEIDGYLHVDMVREIIQWFQSRETNPHNAQLLITSHNVGLLDDLEKEELFIVEKGEDGGTRVRAAQDVRGLRRDTKLYPKYRSGMLGGLPKIG